MTALAATSNQFCPAQNQWNVWAEEYYNNSTIADDFNEGRSDL